MKQREEYSEIHLERAKQEDTDADVIISVKFNKGNGLTADELAEQVTETLLKASMNIYGLIMENIESGNIKLEG